MEFKTLKISETDNGVVIKKKPQPLVLISVVLITIAMIYLLLSDVFAEQSKWFTVFLIFAVIMNIWYHSKLLFGKIVINTLDREITVCNHKKHTFGYTDVQEITIVGKDANEIKLVCSNKVCFFLTGSKKQAKEVQAFVNSYIQIETENEDNEDEL